MYRIYLRLFLFLLPLLLALAYVEFRLYYLPNSYTAKKLMMNKEAKDCEVIVLGSSHSLNGINVDYFSHKGFNFANTSQTLYYDAELVRRNLDKFPKLRVVIINVGYFSFQTDLRATIEWWRAYFYYRYWGISSPSIPLLDSKKFSMIALYGVPITKHIIMDGFRNGYFDPTVAKTGPVEKGPGPSDSSAATRIELWKQTMSERYVQENFNALSGLMSVLRARNVTPVIITSPIASTLNKLFDPAIEKENKLLIDSLCGQYGCSYFNFEKDARFDMSDFRDNDHLNSEGAKKFSIIINNDIIRPAFNLPATMQP